MGKRKAKPTVKGAQRLRPEDVWPPGPTVAEWKMRQHPVAFALEKAVLEKEREAAHASTQTERERLRRASIEIARWIYPRPVITEEEAIKFSLERYQNDERTLSMSVSGLFKIKDIPSLAEAVRPNLERELKINRAFTRRPKGRPPEKRALAIRAYEIKLARKQTTWQELTDNLCPCEQKEHSLCCRENLRREVNFLIRLRRKHQILLTPPVKKSP